MPNPPSEPVAEIDSDERRRLSDAVRHLVDVVLTAESVPKAELTRAAEIVEELNAHLDDRVPHERPEGERSGPVRNATDYLPRSPFVGTLNPMSPPFSKAWSDGRMRCDGSFGARYEGPPGYVHGGWIALAFDELLGMTSIRAKHAGLTGKLTIRYLRPTPLHTPLAFEGWIDRIEGRRSVVRATVSANGHVTAECEGLFIMIDPATAAQYFGAAASTQDGE